MKGVSLHLPFDGLIHHSCDFRIRAAILTLPQEVFDVFGQSLSRNSVLDLWGDEHLHSFWCACICSGGVPFYSAIHRLVFVCCELDIDFYGAVGNAGFRFEPVKDAHDGCPFGGTLV